MVPRRLRAHARPGPSRSASTATPRCSPPSSEALDRHPSRQDRGEGLAEDAGGPRHDRRTRGNLAALQLAEGDLKAVGRIAEIEFADAEATAVAAIELAPVEV